MKKVTLKAVVNEELCIGCKICEKVCPVYAIQVNDRKAHSDPAKCMACANCADRCPRYAIKMVERDDPFEVGVDVSKFDYEEIRALCEKAHLNPEQVLCYCVGVRAEEVAAALLSGATTPEEVSAMTGMRTGCTIECIQPLLRLVQAAGNELHPNPNGYQWYGVTVTAWDMPEEVKEKYNSRGFYFDEDKALLDKVVKVRPEEEK
ncbi:BFD-like [2Fe-2S] binding domain-containing protein [Oscillibacter sp. PC13]|uniref:4Fe-4S binding protein n=1 Tax=Oscillibacter sp. PC13 TaxID=1855299 RepID=UPI0008E349CD|nr:4Fe-4S binding protein [Oscillibacter sp. PC13]SFQ11020.1 BFD-like [2Fe-2S] binding domain-containing protein [Oscillibacter sp. PC13]